MPDFLSWRFPHDAVPDIWQLSSTQSQLPVPPAASQSNFEIAVRVRDVTCRISNHSTGSESAHLVPESAKQWFNSNEMYRYKWSRGGDSANALKDPANMLLLRSDLHKSFDVDRAFVMYPKGPRGSLVVHLLQQDPDICPLYHNVQMHGVPFCAPQYLFARFAWAVFPFLIDFLTGRTPRLVTQFNVETNEQEEFIATDMTALLEQANIARALSPERRRGKKRDRHNDDMIDDDIISEDQDSRGRKRQRHVSKDSDISSTMNTLSSLAKSPSFPPKDFELYPGSAKIEELRQQWLSKQRPSESQLPTPSKAGASDNKYVSSGRASLFRELEDMGFEIRDDENDEEF